MARLILNWIIILSILLVADIKKRLSSLDTVAYIKDWLKRPGVQSPWVSCGSCYCRKFIIILNTEYPATKYINHSGEMRFFNNSRNWEILKLKRHGQLAIQNRVSISMEILHLVVGSFWGPHIVCATTRKEHTTQTELCWHCSSHISSSVEFNSLSRSNDHKSTTVCFVDQVFYQVKRRRKRMCLPGTKSFL